MPSRRRALAGTRDGYRPCARCRHMRLRHVDAGTGACAHSTINTETDERGRVTTTTTHCQCPRFTTEQELF